MDGDKIERLQAVAGEADREELEIFRNAVASCLEAYKNESTVANESNLDAAQNALEKYIARLWPKYFPEEERVENAKEALAWLIGKGYKIAKSKFYKDRGTLFRVQQDGSILRRDLELYAKTLKFLGDPAAGLDAAQRRKTELEAEKLEKQNRLLDYDLGVKEREYVSRTEADLAAASNITVIEANIRNMHLTQAPEWIELVRGDPNRAPEFIATMGRKLDEMFNQLVKMGRFQVAFEAEDMD